MFVHSSVGLPNTERSNTTPCVVVTSVKFVAVSHNVQGQKMSFAVLKACLKYMYLCMHTEENLLCTS